MKNSDNYLYNTDSSLTPYSELPKETYENPMMYEPSGVNKQPISYNYPPPQNHATVTQEVSQSSMLAVIALIASVVFFPIGLVVGIMAKKESKRTNDKSASTIATIAIIVSGAQIFSISFWIVLFISFSITASIS